MKLRDIPFAYELKLPVDTATETLAFLGRKGRGKTYGAQRLFELLHKAGVQCVALDPVGNWWSLRVGKDGKSPGLAVSVFGGPRGDVPILPDAGAFVARVIVEKGVSVVLDVSRFRKAERKRFMTAFAEEFFHLKKDSVSPVHLFVEESHKFIPQMVRDGEEQMLGAMEDNVRIGRNYGIGASLISQRSASVNKDVLSQVECLIAYQTGGRQDKKAVKDWVEENDEEGVALLAEMKSLQRGEALFWSPSALKVFKKIHITEKQTFDASSTPKIGAKARKPVKLAKIDLEGIHEAMKEVVETAAQSDVSTLRKRIKTLEVELAKPGKTVTKETKVSVLDPKQVKRIEKLATRLTADTERLDKMRDKLAQAQPAVVSEIGNLKTLVKLQVDKAPSLPAAKLPVTRVASVRSSAAHVNGEGLSKGETSVLTALIQYPNGLTGRQLSVITGYVQQSRDTYLSRLVGRGLAVRDRPGHITAVQPAANRALPSVEPLPTGSALQEFWLQRLSRGEAAILRVVINEYPGAIQSTSITEQTGYVQQSRDAYISRMVGKEIISRVQPGWVRASDALFE